MAWSKTKVGISTAAALLLTTGVVVYFLYEDQIENHFMLAAGKRAVAEHIATPLDLTAYYTAGFAQDDSQTPYPIWGVCPRGFQVFHHVPFEIGGMFSLWGSRNATGGLIFPKKVLGISVNEDFQTLYVYHGAFFSSVDNSPVCEVIFHYEDGTTATKQMLYGSDIVEWAAKAGKRANTPTGPHHKKPNDPAGPNSKVAWVGGTIDPGKKHPARFCLTAIANPYPSLKVTSMDWYSCGNQTTACIMALTVGKAGLMD